MEQQSTRILIPSGALGIPYDRNALRAGLAREPDLIAIDGGSTDSGPYYLGTGTSKYSRNATKSDWAELMAARSLVGAPLLIGTAGTCGADSAVDWLVDITEEIAAERGERLKIAVLKSGQDPQRVIDAHDGGRLKPLDPAPEISMDAIRNCSNIVALAGVEQIQMALDADADIVIAGRTTDTAIVAALPIARGCDKGAAWHGAKIAECGALATTHPNSGVILMEFDDSGFSVTPMAEGAAATPNTVSAHMLYENSDPYILYEPGGYLDVRTAQYRAVSGRSVRVEGSRWVDTAPYTVKIEGVRIAGYQTISLVLIRDGRYVSQIDEWTRMLHAAFRKRLEETNQSDVRLETRLIGRNAALGELETRSSSPHEIGVLAIFTAPSQDQAHESAKLLNPALLHMPLTADEPMPTFAFPFSPAEIDRGPLYEFCLNHIAELEDHADWFRLEILSTGCPRDQTR